jgi:hypothetical protein
VSTATFVREKSDKCWHWRMSEKYQQHLRSRLKYVSVSNWNSTEYILVVPHYLITKAMSKSTMTNTTSGQDYLFLAVLTVKTNTKNLGIYFVQFFLLICWSQLSCLCFKIYFTIKAWKSLLWDWAIGYMITQYVFGFTVLSWLGSVWKWHVY